MRILSTAEFNQCRIKQHRSNHYILIFFHKLRLFKVHADTLLILKRLKTGFNIRIIGLIERQRDFFRLFGNFEHLLFVSLFINQRRQQYVFGCIADFHGIDIFCSFDNITGNG
ncbi:hypothetical protein SDC9_85928 [bioreactor metagenome]|uniref:Uncharacterized protein n=1 Tax=bioreactor metagenome TaxID=1076179 RepID=A0A644ZEH3_9ZZZZ